jgi:hypothetical protein
MVDKTRVEKAEKSKQKGKIRPRKGIVLTDTGDVLVFKVLKLETMQLDHARILIQAEVEDIMTGASQVELQYILNGFLTPNQKMDLQTIRETSQMIGK